MTTPPTTRDIALITGASSGIGLATAHLLRAQGFALALVARSHDALERAAQDLRAAHPGDAPILVVATDVGDPAAVRAMIEACDAQLGGLHVLVNNAGLALAKPIAQTTPDDLRRGYDVNALGPALAIHHAWPIFQRQKRGCIVNVSTMGTDDPFPGFFAYASAKASVNLMARSCAKEGASIGVRAFAVAPGAVETQMLRSMFTPRQVPPAACLAPEDVGKLIVACIAGERDADNGRTIFVSRTPAGVTTRV